MIIASLEYIEKYMISWYEDDLFSKGKMQILKKKLYDCLVTVKAAPNECVIRTGQP